MKEDLEDLHRPLSAMNYEEMLRYFLHKSQIFSSLSLNFEFTSQFYAQILVSSCIIFYVLLIIKNCFENKSYILFFPHFFRYWTSAEETSKLCQRVQNWEERINPILEEEEQRREFDIHRYESELLENFDKLGEDKPFYGVF